MKKLLLCVVILSIHSCSLFKSTNLKSNLKDDVKNICLSSHGKGRLIIDDHKYVFSFDSGTKILENKWLMSFSFLHFHLVVTALSGLGRSSFL